MLESLASGFDDRLLFALVLIWGGYWLAGPIHYQVVRLVFNRMVKNRNKKLGRSVEARKRYWPTWDVLFTEKVRFAKTDRRPVTIGQLFLPWLHHWHVYWLTHLVFPLAATITLLTLPAPTGWGMTIVKWAALLLVPKYVYVHTVVMWAFLANKAYQERKKLMTRLGDIAQDHLGSPDADRKAIEFIEVLEWEPNYTTPKRIKFAINYKWTMARGQAFLEGINKSLIGGMARTWVVERSDDNPTGWDTENERVVLKSIPPIPSLVPFSPHYILDERIPPGLFLYMVGQEGGVELPHPETGVIEHVHGIGFSGREGKLARAAGLTVSPEYDKAQAQMLICGPTGGGKSLPLGVPLVVYIPVTDPYPPLPAPAIVDAYLDTTR